VSGAAPWRLHLVGAGAAGTTLARALLGTGVELGCVTRRERSAAWIQSQNRELAVDISEPIIRASIQ